MTRKDFFALLPKPHDAGIIPDQLGTPGFDLPDLDGLVRYQPNGAIGTNLSIVSASDSNIVLFSPGFSPTGRLHIVFSAQASGNTVVLGKGADPSGEFKIHGTDSLAIFAGEDRGRTAINLAMSGVGSTFFWGRRSSSNGLSVYVQGDAHSAVIGEDCMVAQRVSIMTTDMHAIIDLTTGNWVNPGGPVVIEPHVWLGWESMIMKGVTLGFGASVAARALVTRDVPKFSIAGGVPGKILSTNAIWTRPSVPVPSAMMEIQSLAERVGHALPSSASLVGSEGGATLRHQ